MPTSYSDTYFPVLVQTVLAVLVAAALIAGVAFAGVPLTWVLAVAMAASAARISFAARALRPALAH